MYRCVRNDIANNIDTGTLSERAIIELISWSEEVNGKMFLLHAMDGAWAERGHTYYTFLTSALEGVSGQHLALSAFYPRRRGLEGREAEE
jgi:hypothetical protein